MNLKNLSSDIFVCQTKVETVVCAGDYCKCTHACAQYGREAAMLVLQICRLNKVKRKFEQTHISRAIHSITTTLSKLKELHYSNGLSDIFILDMELH